MQNDQLLSRTSVRGSGGPHTGPWQGSGEWSWPLCLPHVAPCSFPSAVLQAGLWALMNPFLSTLHLASRGNAVSLFYRTVLQVSSPSPDQRAGAASQTACWVRGFLQRDQADGAPWRRQSTCGDRLCTHASMLSITKGDFGSHVLCDKET